MNQNSDVLPKDQQIQQLIRPLNSLLEQPAVTEITINKPQEVWAKTSTGWTRHQLPELTEAYLTSLATALMVFNGLGSSSISSVVLPQGARGQIVLPPACINGTLSLSIRKHATCVKTLAELAADGAFDDYLDVSFNQPTEQEVASLLTKADFARLSTVEADLLALKRQQQLEEFLRLAVTAKKNIIVAGKTASGKTTFARSLIKTVPIQDRLITIEDVHELFLEEHPNKVHMLYGTGDGRVSALDCLQSCLRQSPDRIFLAELRGDEAWEYLNSLNTGHPGSITTIHANGALATFDRLATLIKNSATGSDLNMEVIKAAISQTVDIVLFLKEFKLTELFYDPIFARSKKQLEIYEQ